MKTYGSSYPGSAGMGADPGTAKDIAAAIRARGDAK